MSLLSEGLDDGESASIGAIRPTPVMRQQEQADLSPGHKAVLRRAQARRAKITPAKSDDIFGGLMAGALIVGGSIVLLAVGRKRS